eukprot:NODE_603_length_2060_cov_30.906514_g557_i0.p1 GENE.NODE_603_length_2060_cov_30.906514_g557_i0~~NODE_603_length_2060_cov_30.906514_g557_i0.p1  ORF type:complete len:621 (+),score=138.37 NODE_603_length_2060_cov_30.906514_g557_i0:103-1965(+)
MAESSSCFSTQTAVLLTFIDSLRTASASAKASVASYDNYSLELAQHVDTLDERLQPLKLACGNLERTISSLEKTSSRFVVPKEVEGVLLHPQNHDLHVVLDTYDQLVESKVAVDAFCFRNPSVGAARDASRRLTALQQRAHDHLAKAFKNAASQLVQGAGERGDESAILESEAVGHMVAINRRLGNTAHLAVFQNMRAGVVRSGVLASFEGVQPVHFTEDNPTALRYAKCSHTLVRALRSLSQMAGEERALVTKLLDSLEMNDGRSKQLLEGILSPAFAEITTKGRQLVHGGDGAVTVDRSAALLDVLEECTIQQTHVPELAVAMRQLGDSLRTALAQMLRSIPTVVGNDDSKPPKDGAVHYLSTDTMRFLDRLLESSRVLLESLFGPDAFPLQGYAELAPFSRFVLTVLRVLWSALESKADHCRSKELSIVLLLNNAHYLRVATEHSAAATKLLEPIGECRAQEARVATLKQKYFETSWQKAVTALSKDWPTIDKKLAKHNGALSKGAKDLVKEMFADFFKEFEVRYVQQVSFRVPDASLRSELQDRLCTDVIALYTTAVQRYGSLPFSTHRDKYIKRDPAAMRVLVRELFMGNDQTAHTFTSSTGSMIGAAMERSGLS